MIVSARRIRSNARPGRKLLDVAAFALLLAVSAYFMAAARGSAGNSYLACVGLVPLFLSIRVLRPLPGFFCGLFWGACLFTFSTSVVATDVPPTWVAFTVLSLGPAVFALVATWLTGLVGFHPLVLGVGWMGVELALTPLGLHRGLLASTQGEGLLVSVIGNALGYVLVAFVVAFASALIVSALGRFRVAIVRRAFLVEPIAPDARLTPQMPTHAAFFPNSSSAPRAPPLAAFA